jgi:pimeloyl-ACP methyl ester carboxylesterase
MSSEKSTIVRTMAAGAPQQATRTSTLRTPGSTSSTPTTARTEPTPHRTGRAVSAAFHALERTSPALGGAVAERLWFRLPRPPSPERRARHTPPGGEPFAVRLRGGRIVRGVTYGPRGLPTAHLVHGWGGWWQQLGPFVEPLRAAGFRVVAHDAPSHGSSDPGLHGPGTSTLVEIADAHDAVVVDSGHSDLVVAHSAGAMSALWAREQGTFAGAYAFVAPATQVDDMLTWFQVVLGMGPETRRRLVDRVERRIGLPISAWDVPAMVRRWEESELTHVPMLAVADRGDDEAPAHGAIATTDAWTGSDLVLTSGLGHRRILRDPEVIRRVTAFGASTLG